VLLSPQAISGGADIVSVGNRAQYSVTLKVDYGNNYDNDDDDDG
jgi:hypothetical protein